MAERVYYGVQSLNFARLGSSSYSAAHGVQAAGLNTRFDLEQVFEFGQVAIYEDVERAPNVELTVEKVLDGYPLLWHLATRGATTGTLMGRSNIRCTVGISIYDDAQDSASGTPTKQVVMSGAWPSSLSYEASVNRPITESMTFVGNDVIWGASLFSSPTFNNLDVPQAISGSGGVNMREDVIIGEQAGTKTLLPPSVEGVSSSGTISVNTTTGNNPNVRIQSLRVSSNFGRDAIYALGKRAACYRYMQVPVTVETQIEVLTKQGSGKTAYEEQDNLSEETIFIKFREGTTLDLGTKNKMMATGVQFGGAGGGGSQNATTSYTYRTFGQLTVSAQHDPSGL